MRLKPHGLKTFCPNSMQATIPERLTLSSCLVLQIKFCTAGKNLHRKIVWHIRSLMAKSKSKSKASHYDLCEDLRLPSFCQRVFGGSLSHPVPWSLCWITTTQPGCGALCGARGRVCVCVCLRLLSGRDGLEKSHCSSKNVLSAWGPSVFMQCFTILCNDFADLVVFIWTLFSVYFLAENGIRSNNPKKPFVQ